MAALLLDVEAAARELPGADERRLRLTLPEAPWPLPPVRGDADLLFLVVPNLAANAVKFSRPGDTVEIRAAEDAARVLIEVADTGPGIPDTDSAKCGRSSRAVRRPAACRALVWGSRSCGRSSPGMEVGRSSAAGSDRAHSWASGFPR